VLSDEVICRLISLPETIRLVEAGFAADAAGGAVTFPAVVKSLDVFNAQFGIKSGYINVPQVSSPQCSEPNYLTDVVGDVLGLKAGGYWVKNPTVGLPGHRAVMLLLEPGTGAVVAVMSANAITRLRTAAGGAVAAKHLARDNSQVVGIIGAGEQAHAQLAALRLVRQIRNAYVWARRWEAAEAYAFAWKDSGLHVKAVRDVNAATNEVDVIITATNSTQALVSSDSVCLGTHITAVGSDSKGKQELELRLLLRAKVVVDKISQSIEIGELQHATSAGLDARSLIYSELGKICAGLKAGRENDEEITVFDSSGVSFQDLVVAGYLLRRAKSEQLGEYVSL
jgi:alanine dehydrogenase